MLDFIDVKKVLSEIEPREGIGDELLEFTMKLVPYIGAELIIKNENGEYLLGYRKDKFYDGWHFVGGIIRCGESWAGRINKTAEKELGCRVIAEPNPFYVYENPSRENDIRGHSICLLFRCKLSGELGKKFWNRIDAPVDGELAWFKESPANIIPSHSTYFELMEKFY
ncbi:MAG: hypothetical protein HW421_2763 [Ignavibacteria bacterium]|nr:hypothetical protein [Ignavibacteria bacterium]